MALATLCGVRLPHPQCKCGKDALATPCCRMLQRCLLLLLLLLLVVVVVMVAQTWGRVLECL